MSSNGRFASGVKRTFIKSCSKCGGTYEATSGSQRMCAPCRSCGWCGSQLRYSHQRFCNNSCAGKWKAQNSDAVAQALREGRSHPNRGKGIGRYWKGRPRPNMAGENNPNWKGGTYGTIRHTQMGRTEYKTWRLAVFKRDGFACVMCGRADKRLQAHHIEPWRSAPDRWFDVLNGVTLCGPCHRGIGDREADFADRFDRYTRLTEPVALTDEERARFFPLIVQCSTCDAGLQRPRHHRTRSLHFCNAFCRREFERAIGSNWRGYAAGRIPHPFKPASG